MTHSTAVRHQPSSLTLSPEAVAILDDYGRFLQDVWDNAPASPDAVLTDALQVLVERYAAFRHWRQQGGRPQPRAQPHRTHAPFPFTSAHSHLRRPPTLRRRR